MRFLCVLPLLASLSFCNALTRRFSAAPQGEAFRPIDTALHPVVSAGQRHSRLCRRPGQCLAYSPASRQLISASSRLGNFTKIHLEENYSGAVELHEHSVKENFCINGRIAPVLFVLGSQKCATTNFFNRFVDVALNVVPPVAKSGDPFYFSKELHVFDYPQRFADLGQAGWLSYYPDCTASAYAVGLDATPSYVSHPMAPQRMAQYFGGTDHSRLTFLVLLRDPLKRMHSSFYHAKRNSGCKETSVYCGTFQEYISRALYNSQLGCFSGKDYTMGNKWSNSTMLTQACLDPDDLPYGDPLYLSLYEPQLQNWLKTFSPNQFVIAPFLTYVAPKPGVPPLVKVMAERIGSALKAHAELGAFPKTTEAAGNNGFTNPSLEDDLKLLGAQKAAALDDIIRAKAGPDALAKLLGPAMKQGLTLFGYAGNPDDHAGVSNWLATNW